MVNFAISNPTNEQIANGVAIAVTVANRINRTQNSSSTGYSAEEYDYRHVYKAVLEDLKRNN